MNLMLNFMDKIYSDDKTMTMIYIIGAVLLFIFIVLLIFSLRKPSKKDIKVMDVPKDDTLKDKVEEKGNEKVEVVDTNTDTKEEVITKEENTTLNEKANIEEPKEKDKNIFEKTTIIPLDNIKPNENELSKEENIEKALDNVNNIEQIKPKVEETKEEINDNISTEIPNVDEFVDNVVKKTYEKNEQFSSVYVGDNTSTMKLDKIMDNVNLDKDVKKEITGVEDDTELPNLKDKINEMKEEKELGIEETTASDLVVDEIPNKLDNLKEALEEKKQEEVKTETTAINKEDLLNKLNALKK